MQNLVGAPRSWDYSGRTGVNELGGCFLRAVDAARGVGQSLAGATPAELDELGGDRDRRLLRRAGTEVEADRRTEPGDLRLAHAGLTEPLQPVLVRTARAHRADVSRARAHEDRLE